MTRLDRADAPVQVRNTSALARAAGTPSMAPAQI